MPEDNDTLEPNPYESPRSGEPLTKGTTIKRSIGAGAILLLTPIAVAIAFGASCAATYAVLSTSFFGNNYGLAFIVGWSIFLIPPVAVLLGMIWLAIRARRRIRRPN
jgi:hypothetical protein